MSVVYRSGETTYCLYDPRKRHFQLVFSSVRSLCVLTVAKETCEDSFGAVLVSSALAVLTCVAHVLDGFKPGPLSNFHVLDLGAYFDNDSCALVSGTLSAYLGHLGECPVVQHKVDVGHA